jgi:hypothetical protein
MSVSAADRTEIIHGLTRSFERVAVSVQWLETHEKMYLAEKMRDAAGVIDGGDGERLCHALQRRRMALTSPNGGRGGKPLYKLL